MTDEQATQGRGHGGDSGLRFRRTKISRAGEMLTRHYLTRHKLDALRAEIPDQFRAIEEAVAADLKLVLGYDPRERFGAVSGPQLVLAPPQVQVQQANDQQVAEAAKKRIDVFRRPQKVVDDLA